MNWIKTSEALPQKPGKASYEVIPCVIWVKGEPKLSMWNCEHLCWDDEEGDDWRYDPTTPTHWAEITAPASP